MSEEAEPGAPAFNFRPDGPTLRAFMRSTAFVKGVRGPIGSGKSAACCVEIFRRAVAQAPWKGVRSTRWAVVRNTGPDLERTTIKTWLDWFPEAVFGPMKMSAPRKHHVKIGPLQDGTSIDMEVWFLALDTPDDVKALYSLELTGAYINEARFVPREIADGLRKRCNRFPKKVHGGASAPGLIMDTNAPDREHWWAIMSGDCPPPEHWSDEDKRNMVKPDNWEFFTQPPAMVELRDAAGRVSGYEVNRGQVPGIPAAENLAYLADDYYSESIKGLPRSEIETDYLNRYGGSHQGRAVYPSFRAEVHCAAEELPVIAGVTVRVGVDFGRTPAAVFAQKHRLRWFVLRELVTSDTSIQTFARLLKAFLAENFEGCPVIVHGDPSGTAQSQTRDETAFQVMAAEGVRALPAYTNDFTLRREAVESVLNRMEDGAPCMVIGPRCQVLRAACEGGYHFRRIQVAGVERYAEEPTKDRFSHPAEAMQYLLLGGGEGREVVRPKAPAAGATVMGRGSGSIFERHGRFARLARPGRWQAGP